MEKFAKDLIEQFDKKIEERFKKFDKDFVERFETRLTNFTKIVTKLSEDHNSVVDDVKTVSFKADKNEEHILRLEEEIARRDEKIEDMLNETDDLRNRGMRKTLINKGFPEGVEGKDTWINARVHYGAWIVSLFYMLNICSIYAEYSFYISNICSVFQMFVPYFKYLFYMSNIYSQFEIFVQYPRNLCYISNICSVLKWLYSLPSLFCTSISVLCFKYSFCISNIRSD